MSDEQELICCPVCKSQRVQFQTWVHVNIGVLSDDTERYCWCNACEEEGNDGEIDYGDCVNLNPAETREGRVLGIGEY